MKAKKNIAIKALVISGIALISIEFIFPLLHIAIFGPLWTLSPPFPFKRLGFLFETELDQSQIPATQLDPFKEVSGLGWSSDGRYLLVVSFVNRRLNIYNTQNWKLIGTVLRDQTVPGGKLIFQFLPNENIIVTPVIHLLPPNTISLQEWNPENNAIVKNFDSGLSDPVDNHDNRESAPHTVAVSRDGTLAAISVVADDGDVLVFDINTSKIVQKIHCGNWNVPDALAFSPDGKIIVTGDCHLNQVSFFDVKTGNLKYETPVGRPWLYNFISYDPDGTKVAVGSTEAVNSAVDILSSNNGHLIVQFPWQRASITNLQWIDDHTLISSYDYYHADGSTARIWDVNSGKIIEEFGRHDMELAVLDSNEDRMAIAFGSTVEIFRVTK